MKLSLVTVLILSFTSLAWGVSAAPNAGALLQEDTPCPPEGPSALTFTPDPDGEQRVEGIPGPVVAQHAMHVNGDNEVFQIDVFGPDPDDVKAYTEAVKVCFDLTSPVPPVEEGNDEPTEVPEGTALLTPDLLIVIDFLGIFVLDQDAREGGELLFMLHEAGVPAWELEKAINERGMYCGGPVFWDVLIAYDIADYFPESAEEMSRFITDHSASCARLIWPEGEHDVDFLIDPPIPSKKFQNYVTKNNVKSVTVEVAVKSGKISFSIEKPNKTVVGPYSVTGSKTKSASSVVAGKFYLCVKGTSSESSTYSLKGSFGNISAGAAVAAVATSSC